MLARVGAVQGLGPPSGFNVATGWPRGAGAGRWKAPTAASDGGGARGSAAASGSVAGACGCCGLVEGGRRENAEEVDGLNACCVTRGSSGGVSAALDGITKGGSSTPAAAASSSSRSLFFDMIRKSSDCVRAFWGINVLLEIERRTCSSGCRCHGAKDTARSRAGELPSSSKPTRAAALVASRLQRRRDTA